MISEKLSHAILKALNLDSFQFKDDTTAAQVPGWDSLNHINVIIEVEKEFNLRLKPIEILRLNCVGDLQRLVDSKLG